MYRIAVIEDDVHIGDILQEALCREGYEVLRAFSGTEAVYLMERNTPDLVLLDLMLPGLTGEELLPKLAGTPVIVVSAKVGIDDKVSMLLGGAADYVTKPFEIKELLARIAVQLRRCQTADDGEWLAAGNLRLDPNARAVFCDSREIRLTRTEYAILKMLMQNAGRAVSKSVILERIGEDTPDCTESSLKQHISNLRKKLRDLGTDAYIEAVWGIGFRLAQPPDDL